MQFLIHAQLNLNHVSQGDPGSNVAFYIVNYLWKVYMYLCVCIITQYNYNLNNWNVY